jgi:hypothetical protein
MATRQARRMKILFGDRGAVVNVTGGMSPAGCG